MAGKGVKLETAYIELQLDDSKIDSQIKDSLDKAGTHARDTGKKMGKSLSEGVRDGLKNAGGYLRDVLASDAGGALEAGKKAGKDAAKGAKEGAKGVGSEIGDELGKAIGGAIGNAIHDSGLGKALRNMVPREVAGAFDVITTKASDAQVQAAQLKKNIEGTTTGLMTLTNNSGKIAGGLGSIGAAAGPLAGTIAALNAINPNAINGLSGILQQLQGMKDFTAKDWFNGLLPATTYLDQIAKDLANIANIRGNQKTWGQGFSVDSGGGTGLPAILNNLQGLGARGNAANSLARGGPGAPAGAIPGGPGGGPGSLIFTPPADNPIAPSSPHRGGNAPSGFRANAGAAGVVPAGAYNGPDASGGFPGWVNSIGQRFGLSPSTYGGHQTTDRHEAGFAPNPQHSNRGVDWGGPGTSTTAKQRLADFAQQHPELFEQVIWQNPDTGQTVTIAGGKLVPASYYANDLGGHRDHVHTRFSQGFSLDQMPSFDKGTNGPLPEDTLAQLHKGEIVVPKDQVDAAADGQQDPQAPEGGPERTEGYMPAAAASNAGGVAGTSSLAMLFNLGNQAAAGAIDTGASAAQMALSAMSFGAGGAAGGVGIQMAATEAKRAVSYGFQVGSILTDAAIEQIMPFGAPRWLGYDYTQFAPQLGISQIGTTTAEKAVDAQLQQAGVEDAPKGLDAAGMASQQPGGPVNAGALPGSQGLGPPVPKFGDKPPAAPSVPTIGTGPTPGGGTQTPTGPPSAAAASPGSPPVMGPPVPAPKPASDPLSSLIPLDFGGGLFDEGGEWKNNTWGLNTSGRSELVLTGAQADAMAAQPAKRSSDGDTYYISGMDADDVMKQVDKKKRLAAMRYTGRF